MNSQKDRNVHETMTEPSITIDALQIVCICLKTFKFIPKVSYNSFIIRRADWRVAGAFLSFCSELFDVNKGNKDHIDEFVSKLSDYLERPRLRVVTLPFIVIFRHERLGLVIERQLPTVN